MPKRISSATTRTQGPARAGAGRLLVEGQIVRSAESGLSYGIGTLVGAGGFGQVFLATRHGRSARVPREVCIKVSPHIDGWVREAYFGQLLHEQARAIQVYDVFPHLGATGQALYCLALEYARHGDLGAFLRRSGKAWPESAARREIAGILEVLGRLHRGRLLHRDLTPLNVFVCDNRRLKLGDFGIVRHQGDRRGITARTLNPYMAPSEIRDGFGIAKWQARDDVYQVGQLLAMLIKGDARARVRTTEVRHLPCSDDLKEIIYRCIGERRKRYETADELIAALKNPPLLPPARTVRTLKGVHLAFTGILGQPRSEAIRAARRAGAIVHGGPSARTTVVVRGKPNPLQAAGRDAGRKLMEIKRLREKGHAITLLGEKRFWQLVSR
ncbi:MAG: protein kinase [Acidobacteria bacterium]|nr:protein kinase [Acidobacteriota bacterium]